MNVPFGLYETLLGIVFLVIIPGVLLVARDCFKKHKNKVDGYSAICTAIAILIIGVYFIIEGVNCYINSNILYHMGQVQEALEYALSHLILPFPTSTFVLYLIPMIFLFMGAYLGKELIKKKFADESVIREKLSIKVDKRDLEVARKTFHITIIAVIVCYLFLGEIIVTSVFSFVADSTQHLYDLGIVEIPWQDVNFSEVISFFNMARFLIVFILAIICLLITFTDLVRVYFYRFYPIKMVSQTYRDREKNSLGPHVYFVFGILFVAMFLPAQPAMITIAISGLGDAFATIVGVTFGKHKYKKGSSKTWEGGAGGFVSSFAFGMLSYFILISIYGGTILKGIIISIVGATLFLIIDYFSPPIEMSDNILNPLVIGVATYLIYLIPI
ncbi:MAG: diacylglycerol/polyprenol kinase family protein [Candidatus Helarchaeota archaeon]